MKGYFCEGAPGTAACGWVCAWAGGCFPTAVRGCCAALTCGLRGVPARAAQAAPLRALLCRPCRRRATSGCSRCTRAACPPGLSTCRCTACTTGGGTAQLSHHLSHCVATVRLAARRRAHSRAWRTDQQPAAARPAHRPWLRTLTWLLYYAFSIFSLACGFYDLYKNLPGLQVSGRASAGLRWQLRAEAPRPAACLALHAGRGGARLARPAAI